MSDIAREIDIADAVTKAIGTALNPESPHGVQRVWVADIGFNLDDPDTLIDGRQVWVIPVTFASPEALSRRELRNEYTIVVLQARRYADAGKPPNDWIDAEVLVVEQLYRLLSNPQLVLTGSLVTQAVPAPETRATIDVLCDREQFTENRAFLAQMTFVYQDSTDYTGASP